MHQKGNGILLLGEFNEEIYHNNSSMKKIQTNNHIVDTLWKASNIDQFPTRLNGSKRIDFILCDYWVVECIVAACYKPFKLFNKGDHRTMLVDLDSDKVFGNLTYQIANPMQRNFQSKDKSAVQIYLKACFKYLQEHNFQTRLDSLMENWTTDLAEDLHCNMQRSCQYARKKCIKKPNMAYVKRLSQLWSGKNVLQKIISGNRLRKTFDKQIANGMVEIVYSPNQHIQCQVFMISFVDDTSSSTNKFLE